MLDVRSKWSVGLSSSASARRRLTSRSPRLEPSPRKTWRALSIRQAGHLKQVGLVGDAAETPGDFEILVGALGGDAAARGAVEEAELDEIGFVHLFNGLGLFADGGCDGVDTHRSAAEFFQHGAHDFLIDFVETEMVDFE